MNVLALLSYIFYTLTRPDPTKVEKLPETPNSYVELGCTAGFIIAKCRVSRRTQYFLLNNVLVMFCLMFLSLTIFAFDPKYNMSRIGQLVLVTFWPLDLLTFRPLDILTFWPFELSTFSIFAFLLLIIHSFYHNHKMSLIFFNQQMQQFWIFFDTVILQKRQTKFSHFSYMFNFSSYLHTSEIDSENVSVFNSSTFLK